MKNIVLSQKDPLTGHEDFVAIDYSKPEAGYFWVSDIKRAFRFTAEEASVLQPAMQALVAFATEPRMRTAPITLVMIPVPDERPQWKRDNASEMPKHLRSAALVAKATALRELACDTQDALNLVGIYYGDEPLNQAKMAIDEACRAARDVAADVYHDHRQKVAA